MDNLAKVLTQDIESSTHSANSTMSALALASAGDSFKLAQVTLPTPQLAAGQVLIKVEYAGLNPVDTKLAKVGHQSWQYPHVPALDGVGIVVESEQKHCPLLGKRVLWHSDLTKQGALAQYIAMDAHALAIVPEQIPPADAVTIPCAGMTAMLALCKLSLEAGQTILIEAGAGAVGQFAIQLAKAKGLTVLATASKRNHKLLKGLGADDVFDYREPDLPERINKALGYQPLDAVLDSVGGESTARNISLLKFNGKIACLNPLPIIDQGLLFAKAPAINMISLGGAWLANDLCAQQKLSMMANHLLELIADKALRTPEVTLMPFNPKCLTAAMHNQLKSGLLGKQVARVSSGYGHEKRVS
ncbi:zinc-binding dehydrogenase [Endozoicomonas sp. G2_1]|uniref:zinc-binding dehydrogenase n=1 Tax=Endozoicomonas sp. G2_1 TaxID=2821091 RepID=UPI001ADC164A|nr:zinc-binding dehydrogenase [Endozoicomonas sp. G2_1]MBO9491639.1 zinc-binding dehydrogenase [Endozoicomonas sp. G2_1]